MAEMTVYEAVGGDQFFAELAAEFYRRVRTDKILAPMYGSDDLAGAERRLFLFLRQYWGGPTDYIQERGAPRLRMRHIAYHIDRAAQEHWLACMRFALDAQQLPEVLDGILWNYFTQAADGMRNTADPAPADDPEQEASTPYDR